MARSGLTYELVAEVAEGLVAQGIAEPGARAVREELAKRARHGEVGSPNTVQRHLVAWRKLRPVSLTDGRVLPSQLAGDLARALTAAGEVARETAEARLAQLQVEQNDLIATGEALEAKLAEMSQALTEQTAQCHSLEGQLLGQTAVAQELKAELTKEREARQAVLQALELAQATENAANSRLAELRSVVEREAQASQQLAADLRASQATALDRAHAAEQRAVAAEARLESASQVNENLQRRVASMDANFEQLSAAAMRTSAAEGAVTALQEQNSLLVQTNNLLQAMVKAAGGLG